MAAHDEIEAANDTVEAVVAAHDKLEAANDAVEAVVPVQVSMTRTCDGCP